MHRGDADRGRAASARRGPRLVEPTMCERCGAVFLHKTWRRGRRRLAFTPPVGVRWAVCPACRQIADGEGYGRVLLRGEGVPLVEEAVRLRVAHVADRAAYTQPERRLVSLERRGDAYDLLTTSQKLAHRIARELQKAFGGRVRYAWDERDGSLVAQWHLDRRPREARARARRARRPGRGGVRR
jgi:NMD protein affecting ribosome stability and mRNA decay